MSTRRCAGFARPAEGVECPDELGRYILELSERLCMTAAELGVRMSARELMERMALDRVRGEEQRKADEQAEKGR